MFFPGPQVLYGASAAKLAAALTRIASGECAQKTQIEQLKV
jgi:hypothetical protein